MLYFKHVFMFQKRQEDKTQVKQLRQSSPNVERHLTELT